MSFQQAVNVASSLVNSTFKFNDFMIKNNGKSWLSEVEKRNQTIAHSFLFCAKMKEFV